MIKKYIVTTNLLTFTLILLSYSLFAQANDENFDALSPSLRGFDYTVNGIRFQQISPNSISEMGTLSDNGAFIITPSNSDIGLLYNIDDDGGITGPNVGTFDYRLGSSDGSEFKIVSMEADMSAKDPGNGYVFNATIMGYKDGASIISDIIDFTASDTDGSVTYTKDSNPAANGGVLTFSAAWENIDEIRFTGGSNSTISLLMIDEIDVSPPPSVPSIEVAIHGSNTQIESSSQTINYRFTRDMVDIVDPITVNFSLSGTAVKNIDYIISANPSIDIEMSKVTFPANVNMIDMVITFLDDNLVEADETIIVTIEAP